MAGVVHKESYQRGPVGLLVKWAFIGFNLLMLFQLVRGLVSVAGYQTPTEAEQVGFAIGATIGFSLLLMVWGAGAIVLGLLVLLTRGDKVVTEEPVGDGASRWSWRAAEDSGDGASNADEIVARYLQRNAQAQPSAAPAREAPRVQAAGGFGKRKR